ncbi:hypothetical protein R5H30_12545 [Sulfitobacter sp. D35]|uniref:PGAP1-like alpha/beta domain-containing protein n=1 Tax=Sulfitobacter sp. D35 TaxID=3083252 RepID=UPI00296FDACB|nr:hypothetical protein [Sulfitobacter sp. D35]MDW4498816.1 hypothetical protein [Sulfitobacter sp. D35]
MPASTAYLDAVGVETMQFLDNAIDAFFQTYDPDRPTIILLPGGLGSRLRQAWIPFSGIAQPPSAFRSTIWVDWGLFFGEALRLPIDVDLFDTGHRIVVPVGDIDYCQVHPYRDAVQYFRNDIAANVLLLGWDWRRATTRSVAHLAQVLEEMSDRALNQTGQGLLHNTWLVGHSMGGMVAKLLMTSDHQMADALAGVITVGTPFYGYFGQLDRIFNGDNLFNYLYGDATVAEITSSWPGMYSLLPIDMSSYTQWHTELGLAAYPVTDAVSGAPVDCYDPATLLRYPSWVRTGQIPRGLSVRHQLALPLPVQSADKLHHLRVTEANTTLDSATWEPVLPPGYTPGVNTSPVQFGKGPGDDTIPAWSAALATTPDANVHDFDTGSHAFLMEDRDILAKIHEIILGEKVSEEAVMAALGAQAPIASAEETERFVRAIRAGEITRLRPYDRELGEGVSPALLRGAMAAWGL